MPIWGIRSKQALNGMVVFFFLSAIEVEMSLMFLRPSTSFYTYVYYDGCGANEIKHDTYYSLVSV